MRLMIAELAARLMAEDGIRDFSWAKRKAARQLGAEDTRHLPANSEIEAALRGYQALYQGEEQSQRLAALRRQAVHYMRWLERFHPLLVGSVLTGTAARHSDINLLVFADSEKDVELFLLDAGLPYTRAQKRFRYADGIRQVPVLVLHPAEGADVELALFHTDDVRVAPLSPVDGRPLPRARLAEVKALL